MRGDEILLLGIGVQPPWQLVDQHLDTSTQPHKLHPVSFNNSSHYF